MPSRPPERDPTTSMCMVRIAPILLDPPTDGQCYQPFIQRSGLTLPPWPCMLGRMEPYLKHLATLGLEPGASPAEVRRAYTELSSVWDPDQFEQGAPLHTQARQQIVKLDQAFHFLMARFTDEEGVPGPSITRRLFSPNPGEAPARRAADSEDSPEPEPPVARARRTTRRPPARKREKSAQAARSPSKLVRRSATVAALALVAFIVVQNPSFSGVRATAISVREHRPFRGQHRPHDLVPAHSVLARRHPGGVGAIHPRLRRGVRPIPLARPGAPALRCPVTRRSGPVGLPGFLGALPGLDGPAARSRHRLGGRGTLAKGLPAAPLYAPL